jgi:L-aminoadipate-semialdehyde dehydrogenase
MAFNEPESLASPFQVLLTAFILLVSRLTGDEDIAVGANVDGRSFVLRLAIAPTESFSSLALKVQSVSVV